MKPLYQCDFCGFQGVKDKVEEHEKTCPKNYNLHGCPTCLHKKGPCLTTFHCKKDIEIPEGKYMMYCNAWEKEETPYDPDDPMAQIVRHMFGG